MLLSKNVEVYVNGKNCKYYEDKGYKIPRYFHKISKKWRIKQGTKIVVSVNDLKPFSNIKVLRKCDICGEEKSITFYHYKDICQKCTAKSLSKENSSSWKGGFSNCKHCGKSLKTYNTKTGLCLQCLGKSRRINNSIQKIRKTVEYKKWRQSVFERDDYRCFVCLNRSGNLNAHLIMSFFDNKEKQLDINNGVTVCRKCHKEFHDRFGYGNNDYFQILKFANRWGKWLLMKK